MCTVGENPGLRWVAFLLEAFLKKKITPLFLSMRVLLTKLHPPRQFLLQCSLEFWGLDFISLPSPLTVQQKLPITLSEPLLLIINFSKDHLQSLTKYYLIRGEPMTDIKEAGDLSL